jgi:4-hydroxy-tetrahydrodipicolinate synthase
MPLHKHLFVEANPIPVKWALHKLGRIESGIRMPMTPLEVRHHAIVQQALERAKVLA